MILLAVCEQSLETLKALETPASAELVADIERTASSARSELDGFTRVPPHFAQPE